MKLSSRDQFEQAYSEDNGGLPVEFIRLQRMGDSYQVPKIARAWRWWERSREALLAELAAMRSTTGHQFTLRGESVSP